MPSAVLHPADPTCSYCMTYDGLRECVHPFLAPPLGAEAAEAVCRAFYAK